MAGVQKYLNRRGPGFGTTHDYLFHPDYANWYNVVPLLHPSGETHNVALPIGVDMNDVHANNTDYHFGHEPLGAGMYFHANGTIGVV
jgi:hypothetical protein